MIMGRVQRQMALIVLVAPKHARPQGTDDLASLGTQVRQLYSQGKYAEATPIAERYVRLARRKYGEHNSEYATAVLWLAEVFVAQGRYAEAESLNKRSLAIYEKVLGAEHPDVAPSLNNLAMLYQAQGRYAEAQPLLKRSLAIREKALGPDHPEGGTSIAGLAAVYQAQARYAEAEPLYKLSACNTAAGDTIGGDALSGLARVFFYAGARALLVSHWYVDSQATVVLITKSFDALKTDPKIGRAEALRRAMDALIAGGSRTAHPSVWAPFVVVGEGGAGR